MPALEEALDVLRDVATGGPRKRAVALARGARLLGDLSASEKRELAVRVAEKAAPHLVPVIESETGLDLTPQQVSALLDMARQLDDEQIDELRATLLDEDRRSDLATSVAAGLAADLGLEVPDDLSALDLEPSVEADPHLPGPPPLTDVGPPAADDVVVQELGVEDDEHEPHELDLAPAPVAQAEAAPGPERFDADAVLAVAAAAAPPLSDHDEPEPTPPEVGSTTVPVPGLVAGTAVDGEDPAADTDADEADEPLDPRPLLTELRAEASARGRAAILRAAPADTLWRVGATARRDLVRTFPDGWQRRRALHRLLEVDVVTADEAVALARTVEDTASRRWVVGSLSAAGLLDADQVRDLVSPQTAERIGARRGG